LYLRIKKIKLFLKLKILKFKNNFLCLIRYWVLKETLFLTTPNLAQINLEEEKLFNNFFKGGVFL
jgi:hypothetical protein